MRSAPTLALPLVLLTAACGAQKHQPSALGSAATPATSPVHAPLAAQPATATTKKAASSSLPTDAVPTSMCSTSGLSLRLGQAGAAAGSRYQPIMFTNTTKATCTLTGYPGVSFVAPTTGRQVGSTAERNDQHSTLTVALPPGATASAMLSFANHSDFPPANCNATPVSGLRVYPPGNTAAAYIPFDDTQNACSTQVHQLAIEAVVEGTTG